MSGYLVEATAPGCRPMYLAGQSVNSTLTLVKGEAWVYPLEQMAKARAELLNANKPFNRPDLRYSWVRADGETSAGSNEYRCPACNAKQYERHLPECQGVVFIESPKSEPSLVVTALILITCAVSVAVGLWTGLIPMME